MSLMLFIAKLTTYHMIKNQNEILIIYEIMGKINYANRSKVGHKSIF